MIGSTLRVRYELVQELPDHPVFQVYGAKDLLQNREVCIRTLRPEPNAEQSFASALRAVALRSSAVRHPGIENLYELDSDENLSFLVGAWTKGQPLDERVRKLAPFSVPVAVGIAIRICEALRTLHEAGLVHGDVSTSNVVVQPDGTPVLQLAGVWEAYSSSAVAGPAMLGRVAPYLAPEVAKGAMPSASSDVYAVGIVLYELVTGRRPFVADSPMEILQLHMARSAASARDLNPSVPAVLDEMIRKAIAKDPAQRYPSAAAFLSDLRLLQDALRFGRPLHWPVAGSSVGKDASVAPNHAEAEEVSPEEDAPRVAPKMSAARAERRSKAESERDVPAWMVWAAILLGAGVVVLVGVWMALNLNKPRLVAMPNVKNMSVSEARQVLQGLGLGIRVVGTEASDQVPKDHVLDTTPNPNSRIKEGANVLVRLSSGSRFVSVPDVRNVTPDRARSMLGTVGLELNERMEEVQSRDVEPGMIVSQIPEPKTKVERFSSVRVRVSVGRGDARPEQGAVPVADYTLRLRLTGISESVMLRVETVDVRGVQTAYEMRHVPDDAVQVVARGMGEKVAFRVYYDGVLVKTVDARAPEASQNPRRTRPRGERTR